MAPSLVPAVRQRRAPACADTHREPFRDNFAVRFGLRTSSWQVSELCLGAGAYSEGLDTSTLLPQYKGVGILRGSADASPTVRTYLADGQDAERILAAARAHRKAAGTLSGMAAGEAEPEGRAGRRAGRVR